RQDEEDPGDEVEDGRDIGVHFATSFFTAGSFFLYIASIRWVTRKPPKMFTDAKTSATKPSARAQNGPLSFATNPTPTASNAPTTITEEIALVTDISGVCSA